MIQSATMRSLSACIRQLNGHQINSINVIYLRELGPAVWRSGRISRSQIKRICDEAEIALISLMKKADVLL